MDEKDTFSIGIDSDNYYCFGEYDRLVEVTEIPNVLNAEYLRAYKWNDETSSFDLDEEKLEKIKKEVEQELKIPTSEERLTDLENAFAELATMVCGGES